MRVKYRDAALFIYKIYLSTVFTGSILNLYVVVGVFFYWVWISKFGFLPVPRLRGTSFANVQVGPYGSPELLGPLYVYGQERVVQYSQPTQREPYSRWMVCLI